MIVQYNLFSNVGDKPCEYRFERYIGQKVVLAHPLQTGRLKGRVVGIGPYYTDVMTKKGLRVGTPTTLCEDRQQ